MTKFICICLVLTSLPTLATDWYADAVNGNDAWDGTSSNFVSGVKGPKKTLQAALDLAGLASGDTLWLLPGDYNDGSNVWNGVSRGCVKTSGLKVKSTDGAAVTFVTGENNPAAAYGYDANKGMRCFAIDSAATGVVVDGVTLRNGCAPQGAADGGHRNGGGFYNPGNDAWLIASAITNCSAYTGGAMYGGNAYRTKILDCTATNRGGHLYGCGWIYNCFLSGTAKTPICSGSKLLNTTVVGCLTSSSYVFFDVNNYAYNSIFLNNGEKGEKNGGNVPVHVANCLFGPGAPTFADGDDPMTSQTGVSLLDSKLACPAARDVRVLTDSPAATLGIAAHLSLVTLPTGYAHLDLAGDPMPTSGAIAAGCYQELAVQTASRVVFMSNNIRVKGYDHVFVANEWLFPTEALHPDGKACVLRLQPVNVLAYSLYSNEILMSNGQSHRHYPESDGWTDFVPLLGLSDTTTVYQESVGGALHLYVDPAGNDAWDGLAPTNVFGTLTGPVRSPMVAVTNATTCSTIYFAPGTYASGFVTRTDSKSNTARFRIDTLGKQLALVGTEGAEKTVIVGAFDTSDPTTHGRGSAAIGGIYASGTYVAIRGLTVTGCGSQNYATPDSTPALQRGAAINGLYSYTLVSDCIITNNSGCMASSVNYSQVIRSVIAENDTYMDVVRDANCYGCAFYGNIIRFGNGNNNNSSYCDGNGSMNFCSIDFYNTVDAGGRKKAVCSTSKARGCVFAEYLGSETLDNVLYGVDPLFAASRKGDFRLGVLSPAIGRMAWTDLTPFERIALARDLSGRRITLDADGKLPLGAVNNAPFLPCVAVDVTDFDIPLAGGSLKRGTNVVTTATATLSVATPTTRPFAGFEVDGVLEETASLTLTDFAPGESRAVTVVSGTNWYVNAVGGDDLNGGGSPTLAKKTIRCATTNAVAGDIVNVMPGMYGAAEGEQSCGNGHNVNARVLIPANVSLVSTDGPEKTVIVGAASDSPEDTSGLGLGPGAVRCVWANNGTLLRGFTLTGGRTRYTTTGNNVDLMAGGIYGNPGGGSVVDYCILSNNCAKNGAGAMYADLRRCRIVENWVTSYGPATHSCWMSGCYIDRNVGDDTTMAAYRIESTTFGPGNRNSGDTGSSRFAVGRSSSDKFPIRNSVFCRGRVGDGASWYACATNCVFNEDDFGEVGGSRLFASNCWNCVVTNLDAIGVAADGRLLATSPAVDLGDASIAASSVDLTGTDAFGTQRIYNGCLDAGAAEFDWRPAYGKALNRRVAVETASPEVWLDGRTFVLPSGELAGTVSEAGSYRTTVCVTGTGTLSLFVGDALRGSYTQADGTLVVSLKDVAAGDRFRFVYTAGADDDGAGCVTRFGLDKGLVLIFR